MALRTAMLVCFSVACTGPPIQESTLGNWRMLETWGQAGSNGLFRFEITPTAGETALLVMGTPADPSQQSLVREFLLPGREVAYDAFVEIGGDRKRSNAGFVSEIATLNWPITPSDATLVAGEAHTVVLGVTDEALDFQRGWIQATVLLKSDPDPTQGTLPIDLIYFGDAAHDPDIRLGTQAAVERWRELYLEAGITLDLTTRELGGSDLPPPTGEDSELWRWIGTSGPPGRVRVVVAPDRAEPHREVVGVAGDVPAPLIPSGRSGVRVIPARLCGPDGRCDAGEARLYGEILAHEVGHHLGLFHPAETTWQSWDALSDTVECMDALTCEQGLGSNLMFPYPVCDGGGCLPLAEITSQQSAVMNGYVGVD